MTIIKKKVNGHGPYLYRVTYSDGQHHWEYLGRADGGDSSDDGQDDTSDDEQTDTMTPEDIEDLSPEEIEELKKEWTAEELEEWEEHMWTQNGLVHDNTQLNLWDKKGYRLYDTDSDAYIDGITGEVHDDEQGVINRKREGDEIVYQKDGDEVARMLVWRSYLGRASEGDEEMLRPIDESDYEPDRADKRLALMDETRKPKNHTEVGWND